MMDKKPAPVASLVTEPRFKVSWLHSLRLRLTVLALVLSLGTAALVSGGLHYLESQALGRAVQPLTADYVDRLVADLGQPPDPARAAALAQRLPLTVRIDGPTVHWASGSEASAPGLHWERRTADGHQVRLGLGALRWDQLAWQIALASLLGLVVLAALSYQAVRRLLRPLGELRAGLKRYAKGEWSEPVPVRRQDELGDLAFRANHLADTAQLMLEGKRGMLLAISHELSHPLQRAQVHAELIPDEPPTQALRAALLRDLSGMRDLVANLLESERLARPHASVNRHITDLGALAGEMAAELVQTHRALRGATAEMRDERADLPVVLDIEPQLPPASVDPALMRLLLRNLLDNALRHSVGTDVPPVLRLSYVGPDLQLQVRDHGPGVREDQLAHLGQPFYRTEASRQQGGGGLGLGLYLCRLVALAHRGSWAVRNAHPGLEITVTLPRHATAEPEQPDSDQGLK